MKKLALIFAAAIIAGLCILYPGLMLNPGELVHGHQTIKNDCTSCHTLFWGINPDKCSACHNFSDSASISQNVDGATVKNVLANFHTKLKKQSCDVCHTDHTGSEKNITVKEFSHDILPQEISRNCIECHVFPSDRMHKSITGTCAGCHSTDNWKLSGEFKHELIKAADLNSCNECHTAPKDMFHEILTGNCNECHSFKAWSPSTFDHQKYFVLDKNHNAKCITCHMTGNFKAYTCYGCHEHSEAKIFSEHREEGITDFSDCVSCHKSGSEHEMKNNGEKGNRDERNGSERKEQFKKDKNEKEEEED